MSHWEAAGKSDEWYTPKYIFDALGCKFDLDAAGARSQCHVPAAAFLRENSLEQDWSGFVWLNPPFGARNALSPWLSKFFQHGNGIALTPDRTSAPWFQAFSRHASLVLFVSPKVKFERPDGTSGDSPSTGTALLASGSRGTAALIRARKLGLIMVPS